MCTRYQLIIDIPMSHITNIAIDDIRPILVRVVRECHDMTDIKILRDTVSMHDDYEMSSRANFGAWYTYFLPWEGLERIERFMPST